MSMGFGGSARIVLQDENTVVYEYSPYNLNEPAYRNRDRIYDGFILINKDALVEPEIHKKLKRMPGSRKKLIVKCIRRDVDYDTLFEAGKIAVENSRYCRHFAGNGIGMIAMKIIFHIFDHYQDEGSIPENVSINL